MWQRCREDRWQLRKRSGALSILPLLTRASTIVEIELIQQMLDRCEDRASQQPGGLVVLGIDHDQFGQDRLSLTENVEALVKRALGLLLSAFHLGENETAEGSNAIGSVVQHDSECGTQLLAVRVVRPVLGRQLREQHH